MPRPLPVGSSGCSANEARPTCKSLASPKQSASAYQVYYSFQAGIRSMLEEGRDVDETVSALADEIDGYLDEYHSINGD